MALRPVVVFASLVATSLAGCASGLTGPPSSVSESGAAVGGQVVSDTGGQVEYWAQFGPTKAYGSETAHKNVVVQKGVPYPVTGQLAIGGLARSTTYHYRLCARDSQQRAGAPGCGADQRFTTQSFACGETVVSSVRLTGNVVCGFDTPAGLVVGASGIEINLAGYGLGVAFGSGGGGAPSILNSGGYSDVTIRNGGLGGAIRLQGASRNSIRHVNARANNNYAIQIEGGEANEVRASTVFGRVSGVAVVDSDRLVVTGNDVGSGLSSAITVTGDLGRITRNRLLRDASVTGVTTGIEVAGSGNHVVDNLVRGPWGVGGIVLLSGAGNVIAENEVSELRPFQGADDRFGDGIFVDGPATGTLLRDNVTASNAGDGIEVQSVDARLRGNSANSNGDFGIDAAAGVTDLGGNTAFGNGNPLQCRNVFCQ